MRQEDFKFELSPGHRVRLSKQKQGCVECGELLRDIMLDGEAHTVLENGEEQSSAGISMGVGREV